MQCKPDLRRIRLGQLSAVASDRFSRGEGAPDICSCEGRFVPARCPDSYLLGYGLLVASGTGLSRWFLDRVLFDDSTSIISHC